MCTHIAATSRLELAPQAPCARPLLILGRAPSQFKGSYKELVQGMNDTLDAVISQVNEAAAVLEKLAQMQNLP